MRGPRHDHRVFHSPRTRDVMTILGARSPFEDRAVCDEMIGLGLNTDGPVEARTLLEDERWLVHTHQITEVLTPHRFVDPSFTADAVTLPGPAPP